MKGLLQLHGLGWNGLVDETGKEQPAVLKGEDAEQLPNVGTAISSVRLLAPFDDDQNAPSAARLGGAVAGRRFVHERRTAERIGHVVPRRFGAASKGVEIE